ncbi:putative cytochrome P450 [Thozetella sp. PMI_491]|nr:putative cytochrome P450 [Thozetella sp. PMI_491]
MSIGLGVLAFSIVYGITLVLYRLIFSPIARFPGPRLAAATAWYEFYYDILKSGKYYKKINELHDIYGPIVRINPWELSVRDADFYSTLYVAGSVRRTQIFPRARAGIGMDDSHPNAEDHNLHRTRRKPLDPFFSRKAVQSYEGMILEELNVLEDRLLGLKGTDKVINMEHIYAAVIGDLIGRVSVIDPPSFISDPEISSDWHDTLCGFFKQITLYTHFTFLMGWVKWIPLGILLRFYPKAAGFRAFTEIARNHIDEAKSRIKQEKAGDTGSNRPTTLVQHLLTSDMPESEKRTARLLGEFIGVLSAGTMTTSRALSTITYFVLADKNIEETLRASLAEIMTGYPAKSPTWAELERIPYLFGCVREGLRISFGSLRRIPRVSPDVDLQYKQWLIPRGTPVGMSAFMMHTDPDVFPEPYQFKPERWIGDYDPNLNRNYVPFSKGSRSCLGRNLAYGELYLTLAVLFRPEGPKMTLFETDETDVIPVHDYFLAMPKLDTKGMRVKVE